MSDTPTLPSTDAKPPGRPSKAELDKRTAELEEREQALTKREAEISASANAEFERPSRVSIDEVTEKEHGKEDSKKARRPMGYSKRLDADPYLEIYQDKQLLWVNDMNGDVQRWIDEGAEPVPVKNQSNRTFEGITDKVESKWVRAVGGDDGQGNFYWVYLLMIDPAVYHEVKIAPELARQELIRRAMMMGADQSDDASGPKLPSYAPNLPTGGRGMSESHESVG